MKKLGFTLAEILIVLGIIGVVSTLTLPNVMADHKKKTFTTQLQRFYNQLNNAVSKYKYENNIDSLTEGDLSTEEGVLSFLKNNFKVTKKCEWDEDDDVDCFAKTYTSIDKTITANSAAHGQNTWVDVCVVLDTGASVCMYHIEELLVKMDDSGIMTSEHALEKKYGIPTIVDLNGLAGPNMAGRDYFYFVIYEDGTIAEKYNLEDRLTKCEPIDDGYLHPKGCFDTIIGNNWVMNY